MKSKKIIATALLGLGLTILPFQAKAVDEATMYRILQKTMDYGKFGSLDSGSGCEVYLEKEKEQISEDTVRYTYFTVKYAIVITEQGPRRFPTNAWLVIDDWKKVDGGYLLEQKIITDGSEDYEPPDGKVDSVSEESMLQDEKGTLLFYDNKKIPMYEKALEEAQKIFDENIEYFLNRKV